MSQEFYFIIGDIMSAPLDDFIEFDAMLGADVIKCPYCGASVAKSLLFDDEIECPECGKKLK